jgi:aspartyl-tRNA(Asn)/glutamyl-tRNA(Gln) amidotransferase subunit A
MIPDEYSLLSAREIAARVNSGRTSAVAMAKAAFAVIDRVEPHIHAFATLAKDQALAAAAAVDARIARGESGGALAGVPVAIKDLVFTKGIRTTFGSALYADFVPDHDDIVVERLKSAGAIMLGKSNASEFGFGAHGCNLIFPVTRNPWDLSRSPGGSSAGSAAAVAAGVCPIAIGSDGGGSIRIPAAFSGLYGMKASMGRVPLWPGCRDETLPGASGWESIEHVGPITRTVADAALMLSVIAGPDARDRLSLPAGDVDWTAEPAPLPKRLRVAYWPQWRQQPIDPRVKALVDDAVMAFAAACDFDLVVQQPPMDDLFTMFGALVALETDLTGMRRLIAEKKAPVTAAVSGLLAQRLPMEAATDAITTRKAFTGAMARLMADTHFVLTPTAPIVAFAAEAAEGPGEIDGVKVGPETWAPFTFPFNLTGQPAASVCCGLVEGRWPVGLQIVGRHLADADVLAASAAFERLAPPPQCPRISA